MFSTARKADISEKDILAKAIDELSKSQKVSVLSCAMILDEPKEKISYIDILAVNCKGASL